MVTSVTRYCMSLCYVRGVRLPQLPGGYLWLLCVTSVTRYCMTLCCVHGVLLPQLLGGYHLVTGVTWYCRTLGCIHCVLVNTVKVYGESQPLSMHNLNLL